MRWVVIIQLHEHVPVPDYGIHTNVKEIRTAEFSSIQVIIRKPMGCARKVSASWGVFLVRSALLHVVSFSAFKGPVGACEP